MRAFATQPARLHRSGARSLAARGARRPRRPKPSALRRRERAAWKSCERAADVASAPLAPRGETGGTRLASAAAVHESVRRSRLVTEWPAPSASMTCFERPEAERLSRCPKADEPADAQTRRTAARAPETQLRRPRNTIVTIAPQS